VGAPAALDADRSWYARLAFDHREPCDKIMVLTADHGRAATATVEIW